MSQMILYTIVVLALLQYLTERWLSRLNRKFGSDELPSELRGIYDAGKYRLSRQYEKENDRFELLTSSLSSILILALLLSGFFGLLNNYAAHTFQSPYIHALFFFGILGLSADILGTPFQYYGTFIIEQKYGFNKTTPLLFFIDKLKGWLLAAVLGGGMLCLVLWVYSWSGAYFCLITWIVLALFSVLVNMFYSSIIVPLFNKQSPLEEGSLRQKITDYARVNGFRINTIYVLDGSKRSTKANAYFSGLGPKKRIVLFDTLIKEQTEEEIVAVLAHEVGHYKKKHTLRNMLLSLVESALFLYLLSLVLSNTSLAMALGGEGPSFHLNLLGFALLYSPVSFVTGLLNHYLSRKFEYQADQYAAETYSARHLGDALVRLSVDHLSNLRPHPAYVFCYYSHPPLLSRLKAIHYQK